MILLFLFFLTIFGSDAVDCNDRNSSEYCKLSSRCIWSSDFAMSIDIPIPNEFRPNPPWEPHNIPRQGITYPNNGKDKSTESKEEAKCLQICIDKIDGLPNGNTNGHDYDNRPGNDFIGGAGVLNKPWNDYNDADRQTDSNVKNRCMRNDRCIWLKNGNEGKCVQKNPCYKVTKLTDDEEGYVPMGKKECNRNDKWCHYIDTLPLEDGTYPQSIYKGNLKGCFENYYSCQYIKTREDCDTFTGTDCIYEEDECVSYAEDSCASSKDPVNCKQKENRCIWDKDACKKKTCKYKETEAECVNECFFENESCHHINNTCRYHKTVEECFRAVDGYDCIYDIESDECIPLRKYCAKFTANQVICQKSWYCAMNDQGKCTEKH